MVVFNNAHTLFISLIEKCATLANSLESEFKMEVSKMFTGFEMMRHEKVSLLPRVDLIDEVLRSVPNFLKTDGNGNVKPIEVTLHGFYYHLVRLCSRLVNEVETGIVRCVIPAFPPSVSSHDKRYGEAICKTLWKHIRYFKLRGYVLVPPKVHKMNPMVLEFVKKDTSLGEIISALPQPTRTKLYENLVTLGEYSRQPFDRMLANVPCKTVNIPDHKFKFINLNDYVISVTSELYGFCLCAYNLFIKEGNFRLAHIMLNVAIEAYDDQTNWWPKAKNIKLKTPNCDGKIFTSPNSPIRAVAPELFKGKDGSKPNSIKIIGKVTNMPFIFIKGVWQLMPIVVWIAFCKYFDIDPDFPGIVVTQHTLKNKLGLKLTDSFTCSLGYHNDSRMFGKRRQVIGPQVTFRTTNLSNPKIYYSKVYLQLLRMHHAATSGNVKKLMHHIAGDPAKVAKGHAHYRNQMGRGAQGTPLTKFNRMNADEDKHSKTTGMRATLRNWIFKRLGRVKDWFSFRCMPDCISTFRINVNNITQLHTLKLDEIVITPDEAKRAKVEAPRTVNGKLIFDKVIVPRAPASSGYPLVPFKVISVTAATTGFNPVIWTRFRQGDFDGDACSVIKNVSTLESDIQMLDILKILAEQDIDNEYHELAATLKQVVKKAWNHSPAKYLLDTVTNKWAKSDPEVATIVASIYQCMLAKDATGSYDNMATKLQMDGAWPQLLRAFWNEVTQLSVSGMKHIGSPIPHPTKISKFLKEALPALQLNKLTQSHMLLGAHDNWRSGESDGTTFGAKLTNTFGDLNFDKIMESEGKYNKVFSEEAQRYIQTWIKTLNDNELNIVSKIISLDRKRVQQGERTVNGKSYIVTDTIGVFDILNDSSVKTTPKFLAMSEEIEKITSGDSHLKAIAWRTIFNLAFFEDYKSWILTRDMDLEADVEICDMIRTIAVKSLKKMGLDPKSRLPDLTIQDIALEIKSVE